MCQKWEGDCGLWVLNEIILRKYAESKKKMLSTEGIFKENPHFVV